MRVCPCVLSAKQLSLYSTLEKFMNIGLGVVIN